MADIIQKNAWTKIRRGETPTGVHTSISCQLSFLLLPIKIQAGTRGNLRVSAASSRKTLRVYRFSMYHYILFPITTVQTGDKTFAIKVCSIEPIEYIRADKTLNSEKSKVQITSCFSLVISRFLVNEIHLYKVQ